MLEVRSTRARNPEQLSGWYRDHLGVGGGIGQDGAKTDDPWVWQTATGPVVFAPFKETTDHFPADKQWMLNLRVTTLHGLVEKLASAGIVAERRAEWDAPETGRFARAAVRFCRDVNASVWRLRGSKRLNHRDCRDRVTWHRVCSPRGGTRDRVSHFRKKHQDDDDPQ